MSLKEKQAQLAKVQAQMKEIYKSLSPLELQAKNLREEIRQLEFDRILPLTPEKVLSTHYQIFEGNENYRALQKYMSQFKFLKCEGYSSETELKALKIQLSQKASLEVQWAELEQFLPFVSKIDPDKIDKYKRISIPKELDGKIRVVSIFEHTCSEYGSYSMLVGDNDMASLLMIRYHSPKILKTLPVKEMVAYIRDNHPYELSKDMEEVDVDIDE